MTYYTEKRSYAPGIRNVATILEATMPFREHKTISKRKNPSEKTHTNEK